MNGKTLKVAELIIKDNAREIMDLCKPLGVPEEVEDAIENIISKRILSLRELLKDED